MVIKHNEEINLYIQVPTRSGLSRGWPGSCSAASLWSFHFSRRPPPPPPSLHTHYRPQLLPFLLVTERHEAMDVQCPRCHQTLPLLLTAASQPDWAVLSIRARRSFCLVREEEHGFAEVPPNGLGEQTCLKPPGKVRNTHYTLILYNSTNLEWWAQAWT